ncbi:MAG: hypothetical protein QF405_16045 [Roseibacillus sp.]|nr:hypothetical protein [Roseibacillus sp.]MCP4728526.1 hypothetical protein [Roseibacillus sp.]MDP7309155.1 hypothetical protein [Roseibacillus sp.]
MLLPETGQAKVNTSFSPDFPFHQNNDYLSEPLRIAGIPGPHPPLLYIGTHVPQIRKGSVLDFDTIRPWMDKRLTALDPNKVNVIYWHDSLHNYMNNRRDPERLANWEKLLKEHLNPLVSKGSVQWKTFEEIAAIYLASEKK